MHVGGRGGGGGEIYNACTYTHVQELTVYACLHGTYMYNTVCILQMFVQYISPSVTRLVQCGVLSPQSTVITLRALPTLVRLCKTLGDMPLNTQAAQTLGTVYICTLKACKCTFVCIICTCLYKFDTQPI